MNKITYTFLGVLCLLGSYLVQAQPTNNPMAEFYSADEDYPEWTNQINWANVIDMSTYSTGADNFEKFENARDQLYAQGGGVLYYPAGTYNFDIPHDHDGRGLMLKAGVVIRGEKPTTDASAITTLDRNSWEGSSNDGGVHGLGAMKTKFVFAKREIGIEEPVVGMWNMIGAIPGANEAGMEDVNLVGIAWVEINRGFVFFGTGGSGWKKGHTRTYSQSACWLSKSPFRFGWENRVADGSHPLDYFNGCEKFGHDTAYMGEKRFVFGCRLNNSVMPNYVVNKPNETNWKTDPGSYKWAGRIGVQGRLLFIANNVIAKPTEVFPFLYPCKKVQGKIPGSSSNMVKGDSYYTTWDHAYGIGIDVNKSLMSPFVNSCMWGGGPNGADVLDRVAYSDGVLIQDNFTYQRGNKGIEAAGRWLICKNNIRYGDGTKFRNARSIYGLASKYPSVTYEIEIDPSDGKCHSAVSANDFQARGMDVGGQNIWIHNNRYNQTGSIGNDGEGILLQRHGGYEAYSFAYTYNIRGSSPKGYVAPYDVHCIGLFHGWNIEDGAIGVVKTENNWGEDISAMAESNRKLSGAVHSPSGAGGANIQDFLASCDDVAALTTADEPRITTFDVDVIDGAVTIEWEDRTVNEVAYKVQRRTITNGSAGDWKTLAYRPRKHTKTQASLTTIKTGANYDGNEEFCFPDVPIGSMNPTKWVDYSYHFGTNYEYRVAALGCSSTNDGKEELQPLDTANCEPNCYVEVKSDGSKELPSRIVSVEDDIMVKSLNISPNPAKAGGNVKVDVEDGVEVAIFSDNGVFVGRKVVTGGVISTSGLASGTYLLKVEDMDNLAFDKLILVK